MRTRNEHDAHRALRQSARYLSYTAVPLPRRARRRNARGLAYAIAYNVAGALLLLAMFITATNQGV